MKYHSFGNIRYKVSSLGFGAMNLPGVPFEQAKEALNYALDHGINYIDTAAGYRNSEEIIGNSISHRRDEFFLATKTNKRDYQSAKEEIERSLIRMKTDYIDLLQIHYVNYPHEIKQVMDEGGAYEAVMEMKREGKVRHVGITGHRPELLAKWISGGKFEQVLFHLNLAQPFALDELIPMADKLNMGRTAMKPLSGGFIQPIDKAIRYPYSQNIHTLISGMTSVDEVKENIAAMERDVDADEKAELEQLAREMGAHNCRRCNYCSCPLEIKIPDVMISSEATRALGLLPKGQSFFENHLEKMQACADYEPCKEKPLCEEKCPYHLPMQSVIQRSAMEYAQS
ncbi:aldo/keto reductase [Xylanibacillus composti]|uniref:Aldo/keto reductase n=1 Tax=Xylanibacillus composti TaxID=1572762 RepID=A0A8J4H7I3_9BACL|nr:aldo/keto reductase [Xylanibacillus composti]MDT9724587.1 aldo/keto reductase [Xylanibacillus composti]GIQ70253.1 aldo/keto reductase [Xylanibacillus composti]